MFRGMLSTSLNANAPEVACNLQMILAAFDAQAPTGMAAQETQPAVLMYTSHSTTHIFHNNTTPELYILKL